jgi:2-polyprenyl-3-methyl-5-hydroxy-6-metoxy-1,4-benzoquinol methylase
MGLSRVCKRPGSDCRTSLKPAELREPFLIRNYYRSYVRSKFRFARRMLLHRMRRQPRVCPYCGPSSPVSRMERKKLIMDILQCGKCRLIFRWPLDTAEDLDIHYETQFAEESPQVRLPEPSDLPTLIKSDFATIFGPDLGHKMSILKAVRRHGRVLDYGCSWGYSSYLMRKNGYEVVGLEVAKSRAEYARKYLGITVIDTLAALDSVPAGSFDIVYTNNVLEHLPSIGDALASCARLLADDGIAMHVLPNFSGRARRSGQWLHWIGEDHPVAPTIEFFQTALPAAGLRRFKFATTPLDEDAIAAIMDPSRQSSQLDGDELLIVAQK